MNLKYVTLVVSSLIITNLYSADVSTKMADALFYADFPTIKELIETGQESVNNIINDSPLILYTIEKYDNFKNPSFLKYDQRLASKGIPNLLEDTKKTLIFLLEKGAMVNEIYKKGRYGGQTALIAATRNNLPEIAKILLDHGADSSIQDLGAELTALQIAVAKNMPDMVALLLEHGANQSIQDSEGLTAYEAVIKKNNELKEELKKNERIRELFGQHKITKQLPSKIGKDISFSFK